MFTSPLYHPVWGETLGQDDKRWNQDEAGGNGSYKCWKISYPQEVSSKYFQGVVENIIHDHMKLSTIGWIHFVSQNLQNRKNLPCFNIMVFIFGENKGFMIVLHIADHVNIEGFFHLVSPTLPTSKQEMLAKFNCNAVTPNAELRHTQQAYGKYRRKQNHFYMQT